MERLLIKGPSANLAVKTAPSMCQGSPSGIAIVDRSIYRGANIFSRRPMVRIRVDLGPLEERPTNTLPDFAARLLDLLPGLARHHCSLGRSGGLVERMADGTWLGHVCEHVALELQNLAGASVTRGKTRSVAGMPGVYDILYENKDEHAALLAGLHALRIVSTLLPDGLAQISGEHVLPKSSLMSGAELAAVVSEIRAALRKTALGPSTQAIVDAARRRGIPVLRLDSRSLVQLGYGKRQQRIRATVTGQTSHVAVELAGDKQLTRDLLRAAGLPAPRGGVVRTLDEARAIARSLRWPVVVKPLNANHGRGVTLNIASDAELEAGFAAAQIHSPRVIVEEQLSGADFRFLVVGGKVTAVAKRLPATVTGDGIHTVAMLVERENADPRRGNGHENVLTRIVIDDAAERTLSRQSLQASSVPAPGQVIALRETANL